MRTPVKTIDLTQLEAAFGGVTFDISEELYAQEPEQQVPSDEVLEIRLSSM